MQRATTRWGLCGDMGLVPRRWVSWCGRRVCVYSLANGS